MVVQMMNVYLHILKYNDQVRDVTCYDTKKTKIILMKMMRMTRSILIVRWILISENL